MAASHKAQHERATAKWRKASSAFSSWAIANGFGNVRLSDMDKAIADKPEGVALLTADRMARAAIDAIEHEAVLAGKAWRCSFGRVEFYSTRDLRRFAAQKRRA